MCICTTVLCVCYCRIAQVKSAQQKAADDLYEMSKPLARYRDDEDLEALLKQKERDGDPMLAFIKKKSKVFGKDGKPKKGAHYSVMIHKLFVF